MPDIKEEILLDVQIDKADAEKQVDTLTSKITNLKKENDNLIATNKALSKSSQENSKQYIDNAKQIEINKQKIGENNASRKSLITTIIAEDNSIKALQVQNRELVKQRNEISTATADGRAKIAIMNQEIDKNNTTIRANVSHLEKQKINIGNYASALDGVIPGLSGFTRGIETAKVAGLAFIATPIGAVIGAIGLALGALIAYFKGSEEGQNRLNRIMNIGGAIMEKVMDVVEGLGKTLFEAFDNPKKAVSDLIDFLGENLLNRVMDFVLILVGFFHLDFDKVTNGVIQLGTGVENGLEKIKKFGEEVNRQLTDAETRAARLSSIQEAINKKDRALIVQRAQTERDVAELIIQSQEAVGQKKLDKFNEAIELEKKLLVAQKDFAQKKLEAANLAVEDDPTIENKKAQAQAVADLLGAETAFFEGIRRLNKQRVALEEEESKLRLENYELHLQQEHEAYLAAKELRDEVRTEEQERITRFNERIAKETEDRLKKQTTAEKKAQKEQEKIEKLKVEATVGGLALVTKERSAARIIGNTLFKSDAIKETVINTKAAAIAAYKSLASIPVIGPALGLAAAIAVGLYGANQVAGMVGIQFAKGGKVPGYAGGGLSGTRIMDGHGVPVNRSNGDNRLATVRTGEVILNERQQQALGGDQTFRRIGVPGFATGGIAGSSSTRSANQRIEQSIDLRNLAAIVNSIKVVLPIQDFEVAQAAKNAPINRATVL